MLAVVGVVCAQQETCAVPGSTDCRKPVAVKGASLLQVASGTNKVKSPAACIEYGDYCLYEFTGVDSIDVTEFKYTKDVAECNARCEKHVPCIGFLFKRTPDADGTHVCQLADTWGSSSGMMHNAKWDTGVPHSRSTTTSTTTKTPGPFQLVQRGSAVPALCVTEVQLDPVDQPDFVLYQMVPCSTTEQAVWDRSAQGIFTNRFSGKCIGFAKAWEEDEEVNNLLVPSSTTPESLCAREAEVSGSSEGILGIPHCISVAGMYSNDYANNDAGYDEELSAYYAEQAEQVSSAFADCKVSLETKDGSVYLVSDGGNVMSGGSQNRLKVDVVEVQSVMSVENNENIALSASASSSLQIKEGRATKSCPTLQAVGETAAGAVRHACWDSDETHWWKRCGFNYWKGECGGDTGTPCHVMSVQDVAENCLVGFETVSDTAPVQ